MGKAYQLSKEVCTVSLQYMVNSMAIRSFAHKGLEAFFSTGSKAGIKPQFAPRLRLQLTLLNQISEPKQINIPSYRLHVLSGDLAGHFAITVSRNWRLTFCFIGEDVEIVNLQDYH